MTSAGGRARVFAVEDTAAQLVWRRSPPGVVKVTGPAGTVEAVTDGGPGSIVVEGLRPDTDSRVEVAGADGTTVVVPVRTLPSPPGAERFRFATISDLHLGERAFGLRRTIREHAGPARPYPERALRASLDELRVWGAQLVVVKGDVTHGSAVRSWRAFHELSADVGIPMVVIPGNHDTSHYHAARDPVVAPGDRWDAYTAARELGLATVDPATSATVVDRPGIRLILTDTVLAVGHPGTIRRAEPAVLEAAASATTPVVVILHHQLEVWPVTPYRPPGVAFAEADPFLRRLAGANPASLVTSGHTHRHRRHVRHGVVTTEVGSTKDYPGTWAGYVVHDGGIRQVVRRVARPDVLRWTETSGRAALGIWRYYSPGRLGDRCFTHPWPPRRDGAARGPTAAPR